MSITYRTPDCLRPHPLNGQIYDADRDAEALRASVAEYGVLTPLTIDQEGMILSGHRRWQAALAAGLAAVPVVVQDIADPLKAEQLLLESNRQREKSYTERMREADHLARIVGERNRARMLAGKADPGLNSDEGAAPHRRTDAEVAELVGLKRDTFRKVKRVYEAATRGDDLPSAVRVAARELLAALDAGETTPHAADSALRLAMVRAEAQALMEAIAADLFSDPPGKAEAWAKLDTLIPALPEPDLVVLHDFSAGMVLQAYAAKAALVSAYVRRNRPHGLIAAAQAFDLTRPTVAGLLILHEEAQGGVKFRPTGLETAKHLPKERWVEIGQTIAALEEVEDIQDWQVLDRCRALIRKMVRQAEAA